MSKLARRLVVLLPLLMLAGCAKPEREFEEAPPPDPHAASTSDAASLTAQDGEATPAPAAEPAADSAWDGTDLAALPEVDVLTEPQLSIELGRRALLQARDELAAQEYAKVAESVDVAKAALARVKPADAADGEALATVTGSLARILPGTAAEFEQLVASLAKARGPVYAAVPPPAPGDATADPAMSEPAAPEGAGHGETPPAPAAGEQL